MLGNWYLCLTVGDIVPGGSDITADKTPTVEGCPDVESPLEVTTDPFPTDGDLIRKSSESGGRYSFNFCFLFSVDLCNVGILLSHLSHYGCYW
jgi:hypothetical protein